MKKFKQAGFSAVEAVIIVLVVAAIAGIGYVVFNRVSNKDTGANQTTSSSTDTTTPEAPAVNNTTDLDSASKALDDTNVDAAASDSTALDSELSQF